jgi:hypothetical protein
MASYAERHKPWLFAVNGAAGVLASVISLALSIEIGFKLTIVVGITFYVIAYVLLLRQAPSTAFVYESAGSMGES